MITISRRENPVRMALLLLHHFALRKLPKVTELAEVPEPASTLPVTLHQTDTLAPIKPADINSGVHGLKGWCGGLLGTQNYMQIYVNMNYFALGSNSIDLIRFL